VDDLSTNSGFCFEVDDQWDISRPYRNDPGYRWVTFAAVTLLFLGLVNLVEGLAAVGNPHFFVRHPHPVIGELTTWAPHTHEYLPASPNMRGWIGVAVGIVDLTSGIGVTVKHPFLRWAATAMFGVLAVSGLIVMQIDAASSATALILCTPGIYALTRYGGRRAAPNTGKVLPRGLAQAGTSSWHTMSGRPPRHQVNCHDEDRASREWLAWRCSAQKVTRAWNEWLVADGPAEPEAYHRYAAALDEESEAALAIERAVSGGELDSHIDPTNHDPPPSHAGGQLATTRRPNAGTGRREPT
jgi:hypothetical protein